MKKLLLLILILFGGLKLYSQHTIGISGGIHYNKPIFLVVKAPPSIVMGKIEKPAIGHQYYISHSFPIKKIEGLHLTNALGYMNKGHNYKASSSFGKLRLHYLAWSFTPEYRLFDNFGIFLGTNINFLLDEYLIAEDGERILLSKRPNWIPANMELSLNMGISINYKIYHLKLGYMPGLTNYYTKNIVHQLITDLESRMYYVSLGIDLHTFKK